MAVNRTVLAVVVAGFLAGLAALLAGQLEVGSWAGSGLAALAGLLATLIDREGFYAPRGRRSS